MLPSLLMEDAKSYIDYETEECTIKSNHIPIKTKTVPLEGVSTGGNSIGRRVV